MASRPPMTPAATYNVSHAISFSASLDSEMPDHPSEVPLAVPLDVDSIGGAEMGLLLDDITVKNALLRPQITPRTHERISDADATLLHKFITNDLNPALAAEADLSDCGQWIVRKKDLPRFSRSANPGDAIIVIDETKFPEFGCVDAWKSWPAEQRGGTQNTSSWSKVWNPEGRKEAHAQWKKGTDALAYAPPPPLLHHRLHNNASRSRRMTDYKWEDAPHIFVRSFYTSEVRAKNLEQKRLDDLERKPTEEIEGRACNEKPVGVKRRKRGGAKVSAPETLTTLEERVEALEAAPPPTLPCTPHAHA
jgi:hypothetical protein